MRRLLALGAIVGALAYQFGGGEGERLDWITDFELARQRAASESRLVLADFTGSDWCSACMALDREVFRSDDFASWTKGRFVLVEIDFPRHSALPPELKRQNDALAERYRINGYPTVLVLDAEGYVLAEATYWGGGAEQWIAELDAQLASGARRGR